MDYLSDDKLEEIGLIKEIDTLKIVEKSHQIKEKRNKRLLLILFITMMVTSFVGQILFTMIFGGIRFLRLGISVYVFISIALALVLIDKGDKSLC